MKFINVPKLKAVLFDLDGTLFDTDRAIYLSYKEAAEKLGYTLAEEQFRTVCSGKDYRTFLKELYPDIDDEKCRQIHTYKQECYSSYFSEVIPNRSAFAIAEIFGKTTTVGIVTTASRKNVCELLDYFGASDMFRLIVAKEDVVYQKPDPECYLTAMRMLGAARDEVIIFEDSETGLAAAEKASDYVYKVEKFR